MDPCLADGGLRMTGGLTIHRPVNPQEIRNPHSSIAMTAP
jgi:hypothetical protein